VAFAVTHAVGQATAGYVVTAKVGLSPAETNALFLSGDTIICWPEGQLLESDGAGGIRPSETGETVLVRTGMFISELARLPEGLKIGYRQEAEAQRAGQLIKLQLLKAGIEEET
jgi:hypothetical protein